MSIYGTIDESVRTETYEELFDTIPDNVESNVYINYDKLDAIEKIAKEHNMSEEEAIKKFLSQYAKELLDNE